MFRQTITTASLVILLSIGLSSTNPVSSDSSDWSTRINDDVESTHVDGPIKYNFDESSEVDSSFSKREVSPVVGPLETPLVWGARIESSPSVGGGDVSPSSGTRTGIFVGGDNKQKVDWALNPGDNKKLYSTNDASEVIEQKKEDSVALAPEAPKQPEDSNADVYKDILPPVLTGKRRLAESDKPVQPSVTNDNKSPTVSSPTKDSDKASSPTSSAVDIKGSLGGAVLPDQSNLKPSDKTIPQHVYTEDQFPTVITIKGREYLVIPHKGNNVQPVAPTQTSGPWYSTPGQGPFVKNVQSSSFGSSVFPNYPVLQPASLGVGPRPEQVPFPNQSFQSSVHSSSVGHSPAVVASSSSSSVSSQVFGETADQVVPDYSRYPGQPFGFFDSVFGQKSPPNFAFSSQYPIYHSSAFKNPNIHTSDGNRQDHSVQSNVFSQSFGQFSPFPFQPHSPQSFPSSPQLTKKYEYFAPASHQVTRVVSVPTTHTQSHAYPVASPPSFVSQSATSGSSGSSQSGETTVNGAPVNPNLVQDPSFSPKLQDPIAAQSPSVDAGSQQETNKPIKPESNLHAPPQVPSWSPYGFSVVAGSYPVQSPASVSVSSSSPSLVPSTLPAPLSPSSPAPPSLSHSSPSTVPSKTHVESPATVTVDTKFPQQSISPPYYSFEDNGVKVTSNPESASPSVTVGSSNVNSAADQPVKGQSQQQDQQVGVAGETLVPTTIVDNRNQYASNNPLSSSGYFVSSIDPVSAYPSSSSSFSSAATSASSPSQLGFPDQRKFFEPPWQYVYNYPVPITSAGHFGGDSLPTYNVHPHYSNGQLFYKSKRSGPESFEQSYEQNVPVLN